MNKIKIARFFSGVLIVAFLGAALATIKVIFFDCKYGQCIILECVDTDKQCEKNNDQSYYDCCIYDTREVSFRDYLIKQMVFYGLICGGGLGIFLGSLLVARGEKNH